MLEADLAITDSGFLVLLWNLMNRDCIHRVSGLEYLKLLLSKPEFKEAQSALWVMPSQVSMKRNLDWLQTNGHHFKTADCYVAPKYPKGVIADDKLVELVNERRPRHVIICVGGGVQEKLGLYLKHRALGSPAIHCIGAAIGFLTGDQVRIPDCARMAFPLCLGSRTLRSAICQSLGIDLVTLAIWQPNARFIDSGLILNPNKPHRPNV